MSKVYNVFISHSWKYSDAYEKLINLLDKAEDFIYCDYSVPEDDPIEGAKNDTQLKAAIKEQMAHASVVIILAGVYSTYSKWINKEINIAQNEFENTKPIIAIQPWGAERTSVEVKNAADKIVGWNTASIVDGIKELG
jgi:hypothetical protein